VKARERGARPGGSAGHRSEVRIWRRLWIAGDDRSFGGYGWRPPTNVYHTDYGALVQVEVAGLRPGDFRVAFADGELSVVGVRKLTECGDAIACQQIEIASGRFLTRVSVPWPVDTGAIRVEYRDGFILVRLPRAGHGRPGRAADGGTA
jgi:HSP20 family molecular chaperone IbpA